jgi:hypothetical protein
MGNTPYAFHMDVAFDGTNFHVLNFTGGRIGINTLYYRMGTPKTDGTISWLADWQTILKTITSEIEDPAIEVDSNGYPWVGYTRGHSFSFFSPYIAKSSTKNGIWTHETALFTSPYSFMSPNRYKISSQPPAAWTDLVQLPNGKMYLIATTNGLRAPTGYANKTKGVLWNGSTFGSIEDISNDTNIGSATHSSVSIGSDVYVAYTTHAPYGASYVVKRDGNIGMWEAPVQVKASGSHGTLSSGDGEDLYFFFIGAPGDENSLNYLRCIKDVWDMNPVVLSPFPTSQQTPNTKGVLLASDLMNGRIMIGTSRYVDNTFRANITILEENK